MRQFLSSILSAVIIVPAILLCSGCYTYKSITVKEYPDTYPRSEDAARLTLTDGSLVESPAFLHILTNDRSDLILGIGQELNKSTPFKGILHRVDLDSSKVISSSHGPLLTCWLKNKSSVVFNKGEYLALTNQDSAGFWCAGTLTTAGQTTPFRANLSHAQISKIEIKRLDGLTTALIVTPIAVYVLLRIAAYVWPTPGAGE